MPYKSEAQRKKFHALLEQGKISKSTVEEFDKASKGMKLPKKIHKEIKITSIKQLREMGKKR